MRVIIAGSRNIGDITIIEEAVKESGFDVSFLVNGGATGIDYFAQKWAGLHGVPVTVMYPLWQKYGKAAGPMRNERMAQNADALIAIWDGKSRGTKSMIELANKYGLKIYVKLVSDEHSHQEE